MPFILAGTTLALVFLMILPFADRTRNLALFVVSLFFLLVSMGLYRSPAVALMPDLTPKPLLSKGNAIINLMGAIGGVYTLVMIKVLVGSGTTPDYLPLFLSVALFMVVCIVILFCTIKENKLRSEMVYEKDNQTVDSVSKNTVQEKTVLPKDVKRSHTRMGLREWRLCGLSDGGHRGCNHQLHSDWTNFQPHRT